MKLSSTYIITGVAVIGVTLLVAGSFSNSKLTQNAKSTLPEVTTDYSAFATCLKDAGAQFYGAFWCPHCQEQKAIFGKKGAEQLPYVECSTFDKKNQTQVCIDAKITGYPTWEFAGGERVPGSLTLEALASKTNCQLPE